VAPTAVTLTVDGDRLALDDTRGKAVFTPGRVVLKKFSGLVDGHRLYLDGAIYKVTGAPADAPWATELAVRASGDRLTPHLRRLLPEAAREAVEALKLNGRFELDAPSVVYRPGASDGLGVFVDATVRFDGARAEAGLPISDFHGTVRVTATAPAGQDKPKVDVMVRGETMQVSGWRVDGLQARLRQSAGSDRMLVELLAGNIDEGYVAGVGAVDFQTRDFHARLSLVDADLKKLLQRSEKPAGEGEKKERDLPGGLVSASVKLDGSIDSSASLYGRGALLVRDGDLYGVPMMVGLAQITHLALPVADPFDQAGVGFVIRGRRMHLERVELKSPSMVLSGGGTYAFDTGAIDLLLKTSNPRALKLGTLTDLLDTLRDELIAVRVTGTMSAPKTRLQQFSGVTKAWEDLFAPKD